MKTLNEITVVYSSKLKEREKISSSRDAYGVLDRIYRESGCQIDLKEFFFILLLNRGNEVIGYYKLSEGGISGTVADIRLAFATALKCIASGMIISHNHPSGNLNPSRSDITLTSKFVDAGKMLDIPVLDHIILTSLDMYSFADNGKI